jgi:hypothetical protein
MGFAPDYIACVLGENFEGAKRFFAAPLMEVHAAIGCARGVTRYEQERRRGGGTGRRAPAGS